MKSNTVVTGFGIASVLAAVVLLMLNTEEETGTPQTPVDHGRRLFKVQGCSSNGTLWTLSPPFAGALARFRPSFRVLPPQQLGINEHCFVKTYFLPWCLPA